MAGDRNQEIRDKAIGSPPLYLKPGFQVGFRDEDGFQVASVDSFYSEGMVLVVLKSGCIWPLRRDELLPPF